MAWFPDLGVTSGLVAYAVVAIVMVAVEVFLLLQILPRAATPPTLTRMTIAVSALLGSAAFLLSLLYLLFTPGNLTAATGVLWTLNFMMVAPPGIWVIAQIAFHDRRVDSKSWFWPILIALTATSAEILMGLLFAVGQPSPILDVATLAASLASPWFLWSMAAAMIALAVWVRLEVTERWLLLCLAAAGAVAAWLPANPALGAALMAAPMTAAFILLFERLGARSEFSSAELRFVLAVALAFASMAGAELVAVLVPTVAGSLTFGVTMTIVMAAELGYLAHRALAPVGWAQQTPVVWASRRGWTVGLLGIAFVADWLMAAAWGFAQSGGDLFSASSQASGSALGSLVGGLVTVAAVTASPFFLGLMGVEMGSLVIFRIRGTRDPSIRRRLSLALGLFGAYTIAGPAWIPGWSSIPGTWPNIGAFGGVAPGLIIPVLGSYALFAGIVFLFGRRAYCSAVCPSAVMYGGTLSQTLIPTFRTSPIARRNVTGSRWKAIPTAISFGAWGTFGLAFGFSAWHSYGGGGGLLAGFDPAVLYAGAIWNVIWYAFFIAIPYLGMSPSRTWGFCTTGNFYGMIGRLGFYKKEVKNRELCRTCSTRDCAKACEVGLIDMPASFIEKGYFRSSKCVGAHDCEAACPYGNLISRDFRDVVRKWLHLPDRHGMTTPQTVARPPAIAAGQLSQANSGAAPPN